jgi:hypothetical protein
VCDPVEEVVPLGDEGEDYDELLGYVAVVSLQGIAQTDPGGCLPTNGRIRDVNHVRTARRMLRYRRRSETGCSHGGPAGTAHRFAPPAARGEECERGSLGSRAVLILPSPACARRIRCLRADGDEYTSSMVVVKGKAEDERGECVTRRTTTRTTTYSYSSSTRHPYPRFDKG